MLPKKQMTDQLSYSLAHNLLELDEHTQSSILKSGTNLLMLVASQGKCETLKSLVNGEFQHLVTERRYDGYTLLMAAASSWDAATFEYVLNLIPQMLTDRTKEGKTVRDFVSVNLEYILSRYEQRLVYHSPFNLVTGQQSDYLQALTDENAELKIELNSKNSQLSALSKQNNALLEQNFTLMRHIRTYLEVHPMPMVSTSKILPTSVFPATSTTGDTQNSLQPLDKTYTSINERNEAIMELINSAAKGEDISHISERLGLTFSLGMDGIPPAQPLLFSGMKLPKTQSKYAASQTLIPAMTMAPSNAETIDIIPDIPNFTNAVPELLSKKRAMSKATKKTNGIRMKTIKMKKSSLTKSASKTHLKKDTFNPEFNLGTFSLEKQIDKSENVVSITIGNNTVKTIL